MDYKKLISELLIIYNDLQLVKFDIALANLDCGERDYLDVLDRAIRNVREVQSRLASVIYELIKHCVADVSCGVEIHE